MDYYKMKEVNKKILEKSHEKVEKAIINNDWDCECFEIMSNALVNMYYINKMYDDNDHIEEEKEYKNNHHYNKNKITKTHNHSGKSSDFIDCVDSIIKSHGMENGYWAIVNVIDSTMEDLKVLHPKLYEGTMKKIGELM